MVHLYAKNESASHFVH